MSDEHDAWFKSAFGFDLAGQLKRNTADAAPAKAEHKGDKTAVTHGPAEIKAVRTKMTDLQWGKNKKPLWTFIDKDGYPLQGVASGPMRAMSDANHATADLVPKMRFFNEPQWPAKLKVVLTARDASKADLAKLSGLETAVRAHGKKDPNFRQNVNGFLKAKDTAETEAKAIAGFELRYKQALAVLENALELKELEKSRDAAEKAKDDLDAAKAKLKERREMIGSLFDIGKKIADADWEGLANQAIAFVTEKALDQLTADLFQIDIAGLQKELAKAQAAVAQHKELWLNTNIDGATYGMQAAAEEFNNARERLKSALKELARQQAAGTEALTSSAAPADIKLAGALVVRRVQQQRAVAEAREKCRNYLSINAATRSSIKALQNQYTAIVSDLGSAPADEPVYRKDTAWGKNADFVAATNRYTVGEVASWLAEEAKDCEKEVRDAKLEESGPGGPLQYFDTALEKIDGALSALPTAP